jgi:hypothetical protein
MSAHSPFPHLSLAGEENRSERTQRLQNAVEAIGAIVRILWPADLLSGPDPDAVQWTKALVGLHEAEGDLVVTWSDEDHWEKYAAVVELAWRAVGHESGSVLHENADPDDLGLATAQGML